MLELDGQSLQSQIESYKELSILATKRYKLGGY
jgi:hypothetical protein